MNSGMNKSELDKILHLHNQWLLRKGGARADLRGAFLRDADLSGADLSGAELHYANLAGADLTGANLSDAILIGANFRRANLTGADLRSSNLGGANLARAVLHEANLAGADLRNADLDGAFYGPQYYSISWIGHGESGRRLHAVEQGGELAFSCGCFAGTEDELREYIEKGDDSIRASRLRALDIIMELHVGS